MPNIANITIKKADGTTDITYNAAVPSAGDKSPAVWTADTVTGVQGLRPRLELKTQNNGSGTLRQVHVSFKYPVTYADPVTGVDTYLASVEFAGTLFAAKKLTTTQWDEAFQQLGNLLSSTLVRNSVQVGYAPT